MSGKCKSCGSYAINPHRYDREPGIDVDLCDVHYWQKRAVRDDAGRVERVARGLLGVVPFWSEADRMLIGRALLAAADGDERGGR